MKINFSSLKVYVNTEIQKLHNVFSPILHSHGNITSNGMIGDSNDNANKNVVTDENGQITIEEKTEGLDSFNYGYIDENLQCHLIKVEEINILSADSQLLPSEDFNLSGEIITDDETNNPIAVKIYLNNNYLETVYTYGYNKSFDLSIEDSELISGENIIKMQCGNVILEHTCLLSQDLLTLTSDKDILSAADNDVATLTATLTNNNVGISEETITFKNGDTVLDTIQTDSNGEASYEYTSQGAGDLTISAEYENLTDMIEIEDCSYYDSCTSASGDWTIPNVISQSSIFEYANNGWRFGQTTDGYARVYLDYTPTYPCSISFEITERGNAISSAFFLNNSGNPYIQFYLTQKIEIHANSTYNVTDNCVGKYEFKVYDDKIDIYKEETLLKSASISTIQSLNISIDTGAQSGRWIRIKDFKIKPIFIPKVDKPDIPETDELE